MHFISHEFLVFMAVVFVLYHATSHRLQNTILLAASYVFYGWWDVRFLVLIFFSSVVDYFCGLAVDPNRVDPLSDRRRKQAVTLSVAVNLGILAIFKYFNFFVASLDDALGAAGVEIDMGTLNIILPVGISFYTFQTMSYTLDTYRGKLGATRNFPDFMLYVSLFPQLVAGPIERGAHLLPQVLNPRNTSRSDIYSGAQLAFWGFFKKMVIADNLAIVANSVFQARSPDGTMVVLGVYAFAFQIYCDFSGYTDIARGVARMLGFDLCLNFKLPYFATSPSDFWRRWHISLSSWLGDYLYIPLGGNRGTRIATYRNLAITMLLGGLWHGAAWNFVIWGAFHGALLIVFRLWQERRGKPRPSPGPSGLGWLKALGFFQITCAGWLIFRANSAGQIEKMFKALAHPAFAAEHLDFFLRLVLFALPLVLFQLYQHRKGDLEPWRTWPTGVRVVFYVCLYLAIALLGAPETNAFIYFQF